MIFLKNSVQFRTKLLIYSNNYMSHDKDIGNVLLTCILISIKKKLFKHQSIFGVQLAVLNADLYPLLDKEETFYIQGFI